MSDESLVAQSRASFGRIEVVPEILVSIAERNTLATRHVVRLADIPGDQARGHDRRLRSSGILLTVNDDGSVIFDIYAIMDATANVRETARSLQAAVVEGVDRMVGIRVEAVNVHIEDVAYPET